MVTTLPRRAGIKIDPAQLDFELARRGLSAREFSQASHVPESTLSRLRHGQAASHRTLRLIANALAEIPLLAGAADLVAAPEKK
jgi:transcriptional regulator with XRE-family HTH domain